MKLTITTLLVVAPGAQVDPPGSPLRRVPLGSKSHTPVTHQLTNQGREVSEVVATRRLVKFPARLIAQEIVRVQDARVKPRLRAQGYSQMEIFCIVAVTYSVAVIVSYVDARAVFELCSVKRSELCLIKSLELSLYRPKC